MSGVADWLPAYDVAERHAAEIALPPERALAHLLAMPVAPDLFVRTLLRMRGLRREGTITDFFARYGFVELERTSTCLVVGAVAGAGAMRDAESWRAASAPPLIKVAADFRAEPAASGSGGARVSTETRVATVGAVARGVFGAYWLVVGPFSALIRRRWLRAAVRSAAGIAT